MVISLPVPEALHNEATEKVVEIKLPMLTDKITENKIIAAFRTVLQAPVK